MRFFSGVFEIRRDILDGGRVLSTGLVDTRLHVDQINNTPEGIFLSDRQGHGHSARGNSFLDFTQRALEIGTLTTHLIDHNRAGHTLAKLEHLEGVRFNAIGSTDHAELPLAYGQTGLCIPGEHLVSWSVEQVDLGLLPLEPADR